MIIYGRNKVIYYCQLPSFIMSVKYGLILLRYSSTDTVLFPSPLLSYSIKLLLQKLFTPTGLL